MVTTRTTQVNSLHGRKADAAFSAARCCTQHGVRFNYYAKGRLCLLAVMWLQTIVISPLAYLVAERTTVLTMFLFFFFF